MISIVIPIYNVEMYLSECLDSIVSQNERDIEVILIDDGSKDNSSLIAKKYVQKYPEIFQLYHKKNGGLSDARNYGIQYVTKDYLMFIDSDDKLEKHALSKILKVLKEFKPDLIIYNYVKFQKNKKEDIVLFHRDSDFITQKEYLLCNPAAWNKIIKTSLYKRHHIEFPKGLWYEDRATTATYSQFCDTIYYMNEALYLYRQRENSIMNQETYNPKMMDILEAMKKVNIQISQDFYQEKEYLMISNLLFQSSLRLLPYQKYRDIELLIYYLENNFPSWKENSYFKNQSVFYKIFCILVSKKYYRIAYLLYKLRIRG